MTLHPEPGTETRVGSTDPPQRPRDRDESRAELRESITDAMRSRLTELGMSQSDLARALGVSREQVSRWLSGRENLTLGSLSDICDATGMQVHVQPCEATAGSLRCEHYRPALRDSAQA